MPPAYILATAGHVDHGKSALVRALTGTDPDRLPEEKQRGITIDLGFAHLVLAGGRGETVDTCDVGVIDVPGHEDFVKNMLAGVGAADLALLAVAADDGWMPQTEEHFQILAYHSIERGVIALTKIDRCSAAERDRRLAAVRARLAGTAWAAAPIVPTSVITGEGLAELARALGGCLACVPPPRDIERPRLWIDRVFTKPSIGTVVTGTLQDGELTSGMVVQWLPGGGSARIRALQQHGRAVERAIPGQRVALNLAYINAVSVQDHRGRAAAPRRGDVVVALGKGGVDGPRSTNTMDVWLERAASGPAMSSDSRVRHAGRYRVHLGTASCDGRVVFAGRAALGPGEAVCAQLRLESSVYVRMGDRFVLRDGSGRFTVAGGCVLDPRARRRRFARADHVAWLATQRQALSDPERALAARVQHAGFVARAELIDVLPWSAGRLDEAARALRARDEVVCCGSDLVSVSLWRSAVERAAGAIAAYHQAHPECSGIPLAELRALIGSAPLGVRVIDSVVRELTHGDFERVASVVRYRGHRPMLPEPLARAGTEVRERLAARPFEPPSRGELAPDSTRESALRFLATTGEAIELGREIVLLRSAFEEAIQTVRGYLRKHGSATVSELRQALGGSRRVVVPLLERLDRDGITLRRGDRRILRIH